jgi:hypothetical protein
MTKNFSLSAFLMLFAFVATAQRHHLEPSVGLDNSFKYSDYAVAGDTSFGVDFKSQRFTLPVYSLGFARRTKRNILQTYNLQFVYRNVAVGDQLGTYPSYTYFNIAGEQEILRLALLFEQMYQLNAAPSKSQFFLGFTVAGGYETFEFTPTSVVYFPESSNSINADLGAVIRYQYQWKNQWRLFVNYGVGFIRASQETYRTESPSLSPEQQENKTFDLTFGASWQLKAGVGIPLGKNSDKSPPYPSQ